ncbi:type I restriction endonuclease subunit R [Thalassotalea castellviae]|uniref:Type I restriction enzyme endonuclease subunit n=1 Tax=Thalassotalea castellviae TaxID=3075612 RepID=A0ABU2ZVN5_9GAMM|nr:HsdR family type I site-specific deoxyribonuclease [Thalassotalea sp. W431]MDT0602005.1 HsdR family type I site-specific deoxyribonuclease [Thalassotalea sp. W431]
MKFTEAQLEAAIIELLGDQGYPYTSGAELSATDGSRQPEQVLIKDDLRAYLANRYAADDITTGEIDSIILQLETLPVGDLYESNKTFCKWLSDGFLLKRESGSKPGEASKKDLYIQLIDYDQVKREEVAVAHESHEVLPMVAEPSVPYVATTQHNIFKMVNQLEIDSPSADNSMRIPDGILYINGLPVVVFEFKSAIREEQASLHDAYVQLTTRYRRDIPQLFVFNALCVISDGVNNKMGNVFASYDFYYAWRKVTGDESIEQDGINGLHTMLQGLFDKERLCDVIRNFIYFPDKSKGEVKIVCRYPQYYAARKLYENIKKERKLPNGEGGSGKGGTYFGATGCGKSFTMQFLSRLLMKSVEFESPTIVLITDRTDLDDQLSQQFSNAKSYIGDDHIVSVESRDQLRQLLKGRQSGGVFLTTIHKFTEDIEVLTERTNVICISDEAHRSQVNLDQKVSITDKGVKRTYGFAKYLHDSLPNATFVGFTGTPIDATLDVFGKVIDAYTMSESVKDEITVRIVYEGRAAKVLLNNAKLEEIEAYYKQCEDSGSNEHQIEESKKATSSMNSILGDPDRIRTLAKDFVEHYEGRINEGSTIKGKAMFVSSSREIAYQFYQELEELRPQWFEILECEKGSTLTEQERKKIKPMERVKMVMTRGKDDTEALYNLLGTKEYRKELDRQFKNDKSNFKIAIVVDMWLTGFDVPFLDTIYIDKPLQKHNLIQTISRVNRKFSGKHKGLVVDYIGIKTAMNKALAQFSKSEETNFEDINQSVIAVKDHLDLLNRIFHKFDSSPYFTGEPVAQLNCLNNAAEFVLSVGKLEKRFMALVKRLKAAYDVCCGSEKLSQQERDFIHFYLAVRSIIYKLTKGEAPDTAQMNAKVREMIAEALKSDGVEEIFKLGNDDGEIDIFDEDYLAKIGKIKLPNTKIMLLQKMLAKAIDEMKKVNLAQGVDFTKRFKALVEKYNERKEEDVLVSEVLEDFSDEIINMFTDLKTEMDSNDDLGISFEEKAFYDILKSLAVKYDFTYPDDKLIDLSQAVKEVVDDKAKYTDWNNRDDIKAELKVDLIMLLARFGYPPVSRDEVYKEIFAQAENFKKNRK